MLTWQKGVENMLRKTCYTIAVLCAMLFFGCAETKTQAVLQIPLLQYDSMQGTLYAAQWNLDEQIIVTEKTVLLQQQDIDAVTRIKWDGDDYIILPQVSSNKLFSEINTDFFRQVTENKYACEVLYGSWHCWKEDKGTVILADDNNVYQLDIAAAYELAGLTITENGPTVLLWNSLNGEVVLYQYDPRQQKGNLEAISGLPHRMNSQLYPEQVAIENGQDFYYSDGYMIYFINTKTRQAELVFSKNEFADSFAETNAELAEALKSCRLMMGIYENELLVLLSHPEGLLDKQWLYYQGTKRQDLLELPVNTVIYLLPTICKQ